MWKCAAFSPRYAYLRLVHMTYIPTLISSPHLDQKHLDIRHTHPDITHTQPDTRHISRTHGLHIRLRWSHVYVWFILQHPPTPHPTDDSSNKFSSPFWLRRRPTTWWNDRWHVRSYWRAVLPKDRQQLYPLTGRPWYQLSRYLQSPASCLLLLVFYS